MHAQSRVTASASTRRGEKPLVDRPTVPRHGHPAAVRALRASSLLVACAISLGAVLTTPWASKAGASTRPPTAHVVARLGSLEVIDPFLPDPASPAVAAIYLTVKNTGSRADALVSATSPAAPDVLLMTENAGGSFGSMGMLKELRIPAHGQASLVPGHDHVMLEQPTVRFKVGQSVLVTLRFKRAGTVTIKVPVVPLSRILGQ
jgi:periplasmic copper chaperone A